MNIFPFSKKQRIPGNTIRINVKNPNELFLAKEGKTLVNLWKKPGMDYINVYISTQSFINGTGKIGEVPKQYYNYFAQRIEEYGKVRGTIIKISEHFCVIAIN